MSRSSDDGDDAQLKRRASFSIFQQFGKWRDKFRQKKSLSNAGIIRFVFFR